MYGIKIKLFFVKLLDYTQIKYHKFSDITNVSQEMEIYL